MTTRAAALRHPPRWNLSFIALIAFVAALPLGVMWSVGPLDLVHLSVIVVVLTTVTLRVAGGLLPWRWHPSAAWLVLLITLQLASLVAARDMSAGLRSVITSILGVLLALCVLTLCADPSRLRWLLLVLVGVGTAVGLYGLVTVGAQEAQFAGAGALSGRAVGIFNQPNQLGTFSAILLMIGAAQALAGRTRAETLLGAACTLLAAANLALSFSRGAWIGAAVAAVLFIAMVTRRQRRQLVRVMAVVAVVALPVTLAVAPQTVGLVTDRVATITQPGANPDDSRLLVYSEAERQIMQRPVLGQGPGNFEASSLMADRPGAGVNVLHSHNIALQIAAEAGLLSLAAMGGLAVGLGRRVWQARTRASGSDAALIVGLACAMVAVLGQGLVDFTLGNPILLYLVWTVIGCLLAVSARPRDIAA